MFNLNDPRGMAADRPKTAKNDGRRAPRATRPRGQGPNQGPPDLDELWRDFNRKLGGLFGGRRGGFGGGNGGGNGGGFQPDMKSAGVGAGLIAIVVVLIWLGTGIFIVQEGQQAVITQLRPLQRDRRRRLQLAAAVPDQRHEVVRSSRRSARSTSGATTSSAPPA
jgi:membrane protease subunit HflK